MREDQKLEFARQLRSEMTRAEIVLWTRLRRGQLGERFRRQVPVGPYVVDFACAVAKLIVEVDGETHSTDDERAHDARRTAFLEVEGWRVVRFWNHEVTGNEEGVIEAIRLALFEQKQGS